MTDTPAFQDRRPASEQAGLRPSGTLGRFELRRQLGQGARSTVWLAYDPRMEREVAIKVLRPAAGADEQAVRQWLQEARSVGRVKHPSIAQVYEADTHGQYTYLVFEYVAGDTLAALIARKGALPARDAVAIMMDVLDAISVAHTEGVIHRDLKPSNILVDTTGRARIMDFGIAARASSNDAGGVAVGDAIGYPSPEAIAGVQPAPSMDLFACGLVLAELLTGKPLVRESDPDRAAYRLARDTLCLPATLVPEVDDGLRALVNRALVRDPQQRFADARAFFNALSGWRQPASESAPADNGNSGETLDFLMRRMRYQSDFPALSEAMVRIQSMATSDTVSVSSVTNQILKDVALTNKLLRVVNSAHFARDGSSISTVSRAVTLVGFNGIRNMAFSLVLLEHMQDKGHAAQLKDEFVRALLAGNIGAEMCTDAKEAEEAFIGSMFQNMGRLLTQFYFPEEAEQVRNLLHSETPAIAEATASLRVLGLSFEALGIGIAKSWGLPDSIQRCMKHPVGAPPSRVSVDSGERIRWVASASNDMADVLLKYEAQDAQAHIAQVAKTYAKALGSSEKLISTAVEQAKTTLVEMAVAMGIRVNPESAAQKVLNTEAHEFVDAPDLQVPVTEGNIGSLALQATQTLDPGAQVPAAKSKQIAETLAAGIQDITNAMVEDFKLADVLRMILETMFRAMGFDRIIFCMRDPKIDTVTGRFGLGEGVESHVKVFKVPLNTATPDLFGVVCLKGVDSMISDAAESRILLRLPEWYLKSLNAPAFLLLPLQVKGAPFGLIYADKTKKGALELDEKELALLRTLRNQAVMAFKQNR